MPRTGLTIEIQGIAELEKFLDKKGENFTQKAEEGLKEGVIFLEGEVKESIAGNRVELKSVDTGELLNSVTGEVEGLSGQVFSDVEHAEYIEYGTSKIAPRMHFRNSAARNEGKIREFIAGALKQA